MVAQDENMVATIRSATIDAKNFVFLFIFIDVDLRLQRYKLSCEHF